MHFKLFSKWHFMPSHVRRRSGTRHSGFEDRAAHIFVPRSTCARHYSTRTFTYDGTARVRLRTTTHTLHVCLFRSLFRYLHLHTLPEGRLYNANKTDPPDKCIWHFKRPAVCVGVCVFWAHLTYIWRALKTLNNVRVSASVFFVSSQNVLFALVRQPRVRAWTESSSRARIGAKLVAAKVYASCVCI